MAPHTPRTRPARRAHTAHRQHTRPARVPETPKVRPLPNSLTSDRLLARMRCLYPSWGKLTEPVNTHQDWCPEGIEPPIKPSARIAQVHAPILPAQRPPVHLHSPVPRRVLFGSAKPTPSTCDSTQPLRSSRPLAAAPPAQWIDCLRGSLDRCRPDNCDGVAGSCLFRWCPSSNLRLS
jgi:hypothetical protein